MCCSVLSRRRRLPACLPAYPSRIFVLLYWPALMTSSLARRRQTDFQGRGLTPDFRGGLPLKMVSTSFDFDQEQFDAARQKMKACPPMEASRLGFKGAAGTSSTPPPAN